jgi:hypothetical protein
MGAAGQQQVAKFMCHHVSEECADGQRFVVNTLAQDAASAPITLVVNWPALLKKQP